MVGRGQHHDHQPRLRHASPRRPARSRLTREPGRHRRRARRLHGRRRRRLHPGVHARAGRRRVADHRPAGRADHPRARLRAALRRARPAYFLDPTGSGSSPIPRYLISGEAQPTALIQRLLDGPSAAARGRGAQPPRRRRSCAAPSPWTARSAVVDLTGLTARPGAGARRRSARSWSGRCASSRDPTVRDPGGRRAGGHRRRSRRSRPSRTGWPSTPTPCRVDAVGHYVERRCAAHGDHRRRRRPGPAGHRARTGCSSAAVSADPRTGELSFLVGRPAGRARARRCSPARTAASSPSVLDRDDADRARRSRPPARRLGGARRHRRSCACRPAARRRR